MDLLEPHKAMYVLHGGSAVAGAAFWEYTYAAGRMDENQVLFNESTWNTIIKPAAQSTMQTMMSQPAVANCVPGELMQARPRPPQPWKSLRQSGQVFSFVCCACDGKLANWAGSMLWCL